MTKAVMNRASEISTAFGGVCCRPSAERRKASTTTIRVNEVTMTRIEGARLRTVIRSTRRTSWLVTAPPWPRSTLRLCAAAGPAASQTVAPTIHARRWPGPGRGLVPPTVPPDEPGRVMGSPPVRAAAR